MKLFLAGALVGAFVVVLLEALALALLIHRINGPRWTVGPEMTFDKRIRDPKTGEFETAEQRDARWKKQGYKAPLPWGGREPL